MHLPQLTPQLFYQAIIKGCQSLISAKQQLNAINIFPVADGDTGDNLASTANAIITNASSKPGFTEMLQSVADASLIGARGNSGIIFSQFFNGLALHHYENTAMDTTHFSLILVNAATGVRAAISAPIDGTMLTMIEVFANTSTTVSKHIGCFNQLMDKLLPTLQATLKASADSIPVLKAAKVVDAGALGFYFFIEGFASLLSGKSAIEDTYPTRLYPEFEHKHSFVNTLPQHRYCTEVIIKSDRLDKTALTQTLEKHGDCLAITGNEKMCRLHIHTNNPPDFFSFLMQQGTLEQPKVDDMLRQFQVTHERKHDIALVIDSSADIPQTLKDEFQIHTIPLNIYIDQHHLLDRYCLELDSFYKHLNDLKVHPKTSLPGPSLIEEKLSYLSQHYKHVLVISIAKSMSGTFDAMSQVAQKYSNVEVIDSRTNSGAQGLLIQYAAELISRGMPFEKIISCVKEAITELSIFVMVDNFEAMMRSGRVNQFIGRVGRFSGVRPIVTVDQAGKGTYVASAFNADRALSKIIAITKKMQSLSGKKLERYCIVHAGVYEKALDFAKQATAAFQKPPAYIENVSPAIGLHAGHGSIALAVRMIKQ